MKEIEKKLVEKLIHQLNPYFKLKKEVHSINGKKIDLLLELRGNRDVFFGIEAKRRDERRNGNKFKLHIEQCMMYRGDEFLIDGRYRKIPIFLYPGLSTEFIQVDRIKYLMNGEIDPVHSRYHPHSNVNSILAAMGIGELRWCKIYSISQKKLVGDVQAHLLFNNKTIWNETFGFNERNYNNMLELSVNCE